MRKYLAIFFVMYYLFVTNYICFAKQSVNTFKINIQDVPPVNANNPNVPACLMVQ